MLQKSFFPLLTTCLLMGFWVMQAQATVAIDMDIDALSAQATHIVHGKIQSIESHQQKGQINTVVTLEVKRWSKYPSPSTRPKTFAFEIPGGTSGDLSQVVPGTPRYHVGQEVVLFLWQPSPARTPRLMGLSQGSYHIEDGPKGKLASRDRKDIGLVKKDTEGRFVPTTSLGDEEKMALPILFERIEGAMDRIQKKKVP